MIDVSNSSLNQYLYNQPPPPSPLWILWIAVILKLCDFLLFLYTETDQIEILYFSFLIISYSEVIRRDVLTYLPNLQLRRRETRRFVLSIQRGTIGLANWYLEKLIIRYFILKLFVFNFYGLVFWHALERCQLHNCRLLQKTATNGSFVISTTIIMWIHPVRTQRGFDVHTTSF